MGMAIGIPAITFGSNVSSITLPVLLVAGLSDTNSPAVVSQAAYNALASEDKQIVFVSNAVHRRLSVECEVFVPMVRQF